MFHLSRVRVGADLGGTLAVVGTLVVVVAGMSPAAWFLATALACGAVFVAGLSICHRRHPDPQTPPNTIRVDVRYPSANHVAYAYDSENRITRVFDDARGVESARGFSHHPSGGLASYTSADNTVHEVPGRIGRGIPHLSSYCRPSRPRSAIHKYGARTSARGRVPMMTRFEWDAAKDAENQQKHGVAFADAQFAFADPHRVIAQDVSHGGGERRDFCFGRVGGGILTVRFTHRPGAIRIFGAGYWRKGKGIYEQENQVHE